MPGDESSLFHSIAYALEPKLYRSTEDDEERIKIANSLRKLISFCLQKNPRKKIPNFPKSIKSADEYMEYIEQENIPGGKLELELFSEHYGVGFEIFSITENGIQTEAVDKNSNSGYVVYLLIDERDDDKHCDLFVAAEDEKSNDGQEKYSIFDKNNKSLWQEALELAEKKRADS